MNPLHIDHRSSVSTVLLGLALLCGSSIACRRQSSNGEVAAQTIASGTSGTRIVFDLPSGATLPVRWISAGSFEMGSPDSESGRVDDEVLHEVTLSDGYFIAETELTQQQWVSLMPDNPSRGSGPQRPTETIGWEDCRRFCRELTRHQSSNGDLPEGWEWDLPTEAQWERACRAGTQGPFSGSLDAVGWYSGNSDGVTHAAGGKKANSWGLQDMHGNVAEWCVDWFSAYSTNRNNWIDPVGPIWSFAPVVRGGSFRSKANECRAAARSAGMPDSVPNDGLGFRPVLKKKKRF